MSITDLDRDLTEYVKGYVAGESEGLVDALSMIASPANFRSLITQIIGNGIQLADVASRSVWHPNGFAKIVLLSRPLYNLRLHIWRNGAGPQPVARENIHNHRWDFSTVLLAGGYCHQEFRPAGSGEEFFAYMYHPAGSLGSYSLDPMGTKALRCVFNAHLSQGSRYTISSEVLHRVVPYLGEPAVSLVLAGPHLPSSVEVFATQEVGKADSVPLSALSPEFLLRHMNGVLSLPAFAAGR
jgi:hypothetical protein